MRNSCVSDDQVSALHDLIEVIDYSIILFLKHSFY